MKRVSRRNQRNAKERRRRIASTGAKAVAAAAAIAGGTQAYGEAIRFENVGGQFSWDFNTLDVRLPVDQQPGVFEGPSSIYQNYFGDNYPAFSYQHTYTTGQGAELFSGGFPGGYVKPLDAGTLIGPGLTDGAFNQYVNFDFVWQSAYYNYDTQEWEYDSGNRGLLPANVQTYIGVRFDAGAGAQYGWVSIERQGAFTEVFAWGYETVPGVPIPAGIPEPGTLALLAFGAAGLARRRG